MCRRRSKFRYRTQSPVLLPYWVRGLLLLYYSFRDAQVKLWLRLFTRVHAHHGASIVRIKGVENVGVIPLEFVKDPAVEPASFDRHVLSGPHNSEPCRP